jgi:plastocyanin
MNKFMLLLISTALLLSCKREVVSVPDFNVTIAPATYHAGDTVRFDFNGNAENIVVWSDLAGHKYEYRNRVVIDGNKLLIKFNSYQQFGVLSNNLSVYASDNFTGVYDTTNVKTATWKDLTSKVTLSTGADQVPSGTIDLTGTDMFDGVKPIYFAFRYRTGDITKPNRWVIRTFNADLQDAGGAITPLAVMSTAAWKAVSFKLPATGWSVTTAQLLLTGLVGIEYDEWVISKSFNSKATVPDKGEAVKNFSNSLTSYGIRYTTPGTYKVVFIGSNASYQNQESVIKELTVTILP